MTPDANNTELHKALLAAQRAIKAVPKDAENKFHKYKYTSAEQIITDARAVLHEQGLLVRRGSWWINEPASDLLTIKATFHITHPASGGAITENCDFPIVPDKGRPPDKATAAALTSCLNYFLRDTLLLPRIDANEMDNRSDEDYVPSSSKSKPKPKLKPTPEAESRVPQYTMDAWQALLKVEGILEGTRWENLDGLQRAVICTNFEKYTHIAATEENFRNQLWKLSPEQCHSLCESLSEVLAARQAQEAEAHRD